MPSARSTAALALALAAGAAAIPPDAAPPPGVPELCRRVHEGPPEARAEAATALLLDERAEARAAAARILAEGDAADAILLLHALADAPAPAFVAPMVAALRRKDGVPEASQAALDRLGTSAPAALAAAGREGLLAAPLEERSSWISALGFARTESVLPDLMASLDGRDGDTAMASLRRLTTLPWTEPRDWAFWWEEHRRSTLAEILADANRRVREDNAQLRAALERETARANELERAALRERLRVARERKDAAAEKAILEKEFSNSQHALRAWAVEEARQAIQPQDLLAGILKLLTADPSVQVRVASVRSAGAIGRESAVEPLRRCLGDAEPAIRVAAVNALASAAGPAAAADLRPLLSTSEPKSVREAAIAELKALKPKDLAPEANRLLAGEWERPVGESVAPALIELVGALGDASSVDVLVAVLSGSGDKTLRFRAAKALGDLRSPRAVTPLIAEMDRPGAGREKDVAAEMVRALAQSGGDDARRRLERVLGEFLKGEEANPKARENAARGLARIGTPESVEPLMACATGDPDAAVRKEAWEAAVALAQWAPNRLDALEALLVRLGTDGGEAARRVGVRTTIVKPGNFPESVERVKAHLRPLADDYFLLKDWANALRAYGEAAAAAPDDAALAVRQVTCRVRTADMAGALAAGELLLPKAAPATAAGVELRRALVEARGAAPDAWRTLQYIPEDAVLAGLPAEDREWFTGERARLAELSRARGAEFRAKFPGYGAAKEEGRRAILEAAKAASPRDVAAVLVAALEGADVAARDAAAALSESVAGVAIPAEDGEPRRQSIETLKQWAARSAP